MASDDETCPYPSDEEVEEEEDAYDEDADDEALGFDGDDFIASGRNENLTRSKGHDVQVLSEEDIRERQAASVREVVGILNVSPVEASILLRAFKWNVSHATDEWFGDEEAVRARLGLLEGTSASEKAGATSSKGKGKGKGKRGAASPVFCGICFDSFDESETASAACGHRFCKGCWTNYFSVEIAEGPGCLSLRCPTPGCKCAVGDDMIQGLVGPTKRAQFGKFLLRSYVDSSTAVKWCPAPGCVYAVALDSWRAGPSSGSGAGGRCMSANVECKCGQCFCWNCLEEPHRPVECDVVKKWLVKNNSESENMNWMLANSKLCPKCKRPIEKNHGCMHMTCSAPCKYEFCWLCLGDWKAHSDSTGGFYACNRYEEAKKKGDLSEEEQRKERASQSLERYLHYYERWATNETSRKKAMESLHFVQEQLTDRLRSQLGVPAAELSFLCEAWQQVVECRRVLKWTFAYGYYLEGDGEQSRRRRELFEYSQGQADGALGALHKCAEKDVEDFQQKGQFCDGEMAMVAWHAPGLARFLEFKSKLTSLTHVTRNFFDNLVKALESGLAEVDDVPAPAGEGASGATAGKGPAHGGKGKGRPAKSKKKRRRSERGSGDAGEGGAKQEDSSGMATIDSGDDDLESGEEGDTNQASGSERRFTSSMRGAGEEHWQCRHCTLVNGSLDVGCSACGLPREGQQE